MDSCVMPAVADVGHDEVLSGSTCPLEKSCRGLGELVASQMTDENALVEASLSAGTSASERSQHCSSSYRTPDDPPSYPPSPSSPFPNYPLVFRGGSYRPHIGRPHRLRPKSSPSPEPLRVWSPGIFARPLPSNL